MAYRPVLPPYAHQVTAGQKLARNNAFALFMGMRTGKTKTEIDEFGEKFYAKECNRLLITAPAGAYRPWVSELEKHMPEWMHGRALIALWDSAGTVAQKREVESVIRAPFDRGQPKVLIIDVEAFSTGTKAYDACEAFLSPGNGHAIMAVDESTTIKNPASTRSKQVVKLGRLATFRRIMSGLPTPRSPLDAYAQFKFLDPRIINANSYTSFLKRYAVTHKMKIGGREQEIIVGYKNEDDLRERTEPFSFRVRLEDCYDVPDKLYLSREVEHTPEQRRLYKELQDNWTARLATGEYVTVTQVITQMLRLHQLNCGHLVDEENNFHEVPSNRVKVLMGVLNEYDGKAIVWCSYDPDVRKVTERIRQEFGERSVANFWGGNVKTREEDSRRFKEDPECRYMVATPSAGGRGRTWPEAHLMVYYSNTDNLEHRDQSEERASEVGKTEKVTVVDLMVRGTVDTTIVGNLRKKINMSSAFLGDDARRWLV